MARDLKYTRNIELLLTLMLVKQQLSVFFYTGKSHKIGEARWCCNNGLDGSEQERGITITSAYNLFLEFSNDTR
jgi:hypothetical protein